MVGPALLSLGMHELSHVLFHCSPLSTAQLTFKDPQLLPAHLLSVALSMVVRVRLGLLGKGRMG